MDELLTGLGYALVLCSGVIGAVRSYAGGSGIAAVCKFTGWTSLLFLGLVALASMSDPANIMLIAFIPVGVMLFFLCGVAGAILGKLMAPSRR